MYSSLGSKMYDIFDLLLIKINTTLKKCIDIYIIFFIIIYGNI